MPAPPPGPSCRRSGPRPVRPAPIRRRRHGVPQLGVSWNVRPFCHPCGERTQEDGRCVWVALRSRSGLPATRCSPPRRSWPRLPPCRILITRPARRVGAMPGVQVCSRPGRGDVVAPQSAHEAGPRCPVGDGALGPMISLQSTSTRRTRTRRPAPRCCNSCFAWQKGAAEELAPPDIAPSCAAATSASPFVKVRRNAALAVLPRRSRRRPWDFVVATPSHRATLRWPG